MIILCPLCGKVFGERSPLSDKSEVHVFCDLCKPKFEEEPNA